MSITGFMLNWSNFDNVLEKAAGRLTQTDEVLASLGELLRSQSWRNFEQEQAPDGRKWKQSRRAAAQSGKTLQNSARLRSSITYKKASLEKAVYVGTNLPYAAIHQFGGRTGRNRRVNMPPRPYIGLNKEIMDEAQAILSDFLTASFK